jgi:hypothetical protein
MEYVDIFLDIWYNLPPLVIMFLVWCSLWSFGTYIFPVLVCLVREKSGNPGLAEKQP